MRSRACSAYGEYASAARLRLRLLSTKTTIGDLVLLLRRFAPALVPGWFAGSLLRRFAAALVLGWFAGSLLRRFAAALACVVRRFAASPLCGGAGLCGLLLCAGCWAWVVNGYRGMGRRIVCGWLLRHVYLARTAGGVLAGTFFTARERRVARASASRSAPFRASPHR
jgi:hypothetical protein